MNEYINLSLENIEEEHICCAIGDPKHQEGVDCKKEWIKNKLEDGHVFRKLNARGKIFIEYEPIETAWIPINGKNYEYIYCLWVAGSFKGKGIGKELLEYAINDSKEKGKSGICTLVSKKKKPFIGEKKFFEHYGFEVVDSIEDYELMALKFEESEYFQERMKIRHRIEEKNGELKEAHGLRKADSRGLFAMHLQMYFTAFTANVKRIVRLEELAME